MNTKEFFDKLKPWSKRKHRLLEKYLPPFSAKVATTTQNREIFCIDGFAGAAKYDDDSEGSPLLIARFSDICKQWKNPVFLKLINVEPDKENVGIFDSLTDATKDWIDSGIVSNIKSEFFDALPTILQKIGNQPALFFIDPLGPTHVHFSHLLPIFERTQRITVLIINFDTDGLHRIARAALSPNTNSKVAETDARLVTEIVGSSGWLEKFKSSNFTTGEGETALLYEYLHNIRKHGYEVVAYQIREELNKRSQYHFVYCTRHRDGIALMNDFLREEEDLLYGEHVEKRLSLFSDEAALERVIEERRNTLRVMMEIYLDNNSAVTRSTIRRELLPPNFGEFHSKDYNAVVQTLLDEKLLVEKTGKKRINDQDILIYSRL